MIYSFIPYLALIHWAMGSFFIHMFRTTFGAPTLRLWGPATLYTDVSNPHEQVKRQHCELLCSGDGNGVSGAQTEALSLSLLCLFAYLAIAGMEQTYLGGIYYTELCILVTITYSCACLTPESTSNNIQDQSPEWHRDLWSHRVRSFYINCVFIAQSNTNNNMFVRAASTPLGNWRALHMSHSDEYMGLHLSVPMVLYDCVYTTLTQKH